MLNPFFADVLVNESAQDKPFAQAHPVFCLIGGAFILAMIWPKTRNIIVRLLGGVGKTMDQVENVRHTQAAYVFQWVAAVIRGCVYAFCGAVLVFAFGIKSPFSIVVYVLFFLWGVNSARPRSKPGAEKEQGRDFDEGGR